MFLHFIYSLEEEGYKSNQHIVDNSGALMIISSYQKLSLKDLNYNIVDKFEVMFHTTLNYTTNTLLIINPYYLGIFSLK